MVRCHCPVCKDWRDKRNQEGESLLRIEEECADIIADLFFAYVNKNEGFPHGFEIAAVENATKYLNEKYKGSKFAEGWFQNRLKEMKEW